MSDLKAILEALAPALTILAGLLGAAIGAIVQASSMRKQLELQHKNQLDQIGTAHRHNLEVLERQQNGQVALREKQFAEADQADRLRVLEYVDMLLPRLLDICRIEWLGDNNVNTDELRRYRNLRTYMDTDDVDVAHPERNLGLRITFLLLQLTAAMRLALNARWTRSLTPKQDEFLREWDARLEPIIVSGRYQGKQLLYREQIEVITELMLTRSATTGVTRPLTWLEFCEALKTVPAFAKIANLIRDKLVFIFNEGNNLPPRRAMQCRLAIMGLYLIRLSNLADHQAWAKEEGALWEVAGRWYDWQVLEGQSPDWFIFEPGDVERYMLKTPKYLGIARPLPHTGAPTQLTLEGCVKVGSVQKGRVKYTDPRFVYFEVAGERGRCHISKWSTSYVSSLEEEVQSGEEVEVMVIARSQKGLELTRIAVAEAQGQTS